MFGVFGDDTHAGVDNLCNNLVLLLALWGISGPFSVVRLAFRFILLFSLILEQKQLVIEGVLTVRCEFSSVFAGHSELCEGVWLIVGGGVKKLRGVGLEPFFLAGEFGNWWTGELGGGGDEALEVVGVIKLYEFFVLARRSALL
jgi:hypothetical protein